MKKYKVLIAIQTHKLDVKSLQLAQLQQEYKKLDEQLENQYQCHADMLLYIDVIHLHAQQIKQKMQVIAQRINHIKQEVQNLMCEKHKMEKALEKHQDRIQHQRRQKEVVNMDNIAIMNCLVKNIFK